MSTNPLYGIHAHYQSLIGFSNTKGETITLEIYTV